MIPGAALSLAVLGVAFVTGADKGAGRWLVVECLILFMFFNAGGIQVVGWLTGSEICPLAVRGAGTSVQSATLWTTNLLITLTLLSMINAIGVGASMWLYAIFKVLAFIFVQRKMPEMAGRILEDIEGSLLDGNFRPGGVPASTGARRAA